MRFATKEEAASNSTTILKSEKAILLLASKALRNVRVRIGREPQEIILELLVAAVIASTKDNPEIMLARRTNKLNRWGYGVEMLLFTTFNDIEKIFYQVGIPDEKSNCRRWKT